MKLKENCFILTICLFPMILLIFILRLTDFLKSNWYYLVAVILSLVFFFTFIMSLFCAVSEITNSKKWYRIWFLLLIPLFYLPIYYVKYVNKDDKYLGYLLSLINIILLVVLLPKVKDKLTNYVLEENRKDFALKTTFNYMDKNKLFTIDVDNTYVCNTKLTGYALTCERSKDDSFIGIYVYQDKKFSEGKIDDIKDYHLDDVLDTIKENNYEYSLIELDNQYLINYNDMTILFKTQLYQKDDKEYVFVIVKECPNYDENILDFEKMIKSIEFIK